MSCSPARRLRRQALNIAHQQKQNIIDTNRQHLQESIATKNGLMKLYDEDQNFVLTHINKMGDCFDIATFNNAFSANLKKMTHRKAFEEALYETLRIDKTSLQIEVLTSTSARDFAKVAGIPLAQQPVAQA